MPLDTRATISLRPLPPLPPSPAVRSTQTEPVRGDITNQFGAAVMDREGPYAVHVDVAGPLGHGIVDTMVDATYDLRPAPYMPWKSPTRSRMRPGLSSALDLLAFS